MIAESPLALAYILPDDVFFLKDDRQAAALNATAIAESTAAEPVAAYQAPEPVADAPATPAAPQVIERPAEPTVSIPAITPPVAAQTSAPAAATAPATPITQDFKYQGNFNQKFLIVVHYPGQDGMDAPHFAALERTIKRKEMSMDDVAIFNIANYPGTDLKAIARFFKPMRMLLLGKDAFPIGLVPQPFNQLTMLGKCHLLYSDSFKDMMGNKDKVKAFWEQMKLL
ncbi:hypothetical protein [Mucilaginibacter myungsuensis]|uniref:Uncharacterized protein n=1 Tax=Mucilaginibacter myungsuensis TaxID=649104 RepID=A0A929PW52_9SPHI|nr:hypothetical protein [Mucilaginibacter myungsuensis]MBE9661716.1 hypothetical protein [Mucilaginibacter myungsuensis]MDN3597859.1 hypothetical protein [Mucilaginibacter myungsuensis]